jgi:hypothetical protein
MSNKQAKIELKPGGAPGSLAPAEPLAPAAEARAFFERVHGSRSRDNSSDDRAERKKSKKSDTEEKTAQAPEGVVSAMAMAQALAAQLPTQTPGSPLPASQSSSALQALGASSATNINQLLQARRDTTKLDNGVSERISEKDREEETGASDPDANTDSGGDGRISFDAQLSTQAALQQLQSQPKRDNQDSSEKRHKGMLAQLIDELVECLHVSERMRADDWHIVIKLKSEILEGTQLHLENYGRRLSVKLQTNNKQAFDLLCQERFELQNTLRTTIDQDIVVTTEKV